VKLVAADALLARREQVDGLQPNPQRNMTRLKDGPDRHSKRLAALVALIEADPGALAFHLGNPVETAAMGADRTCRPHACFKIRIGRFFVMKMFGIYDRVLRSRVSYRKNKAIMTVRVRQVLSDFPPKARISTHLWITELNFSRASSGVDAATPIENGHPFGAIASHPPPVLLTKSGVKWSTVDASVDGWSTVAVDAAVDG
jgi:hypothetical protein